MRLALRNTVPVNWPPVRLSPLRSTPVRLQFWHVRVEATKSWADSNLIEDAVLLLRGVPLRHETFPLMIWGCPPQLVSANRTTWVFGPTCTDWVVSLRRNTVWVDGSVNCRAAKLGRSALTTQVPLEAS